MRKSISVAFFSTVATLMILGVAVMGLSQLVLFSRYFAQERFATLDDVGDLAARTATYVWKGLDEQVEQSAPEGQDSKVAERLKAILGQVDLIGQSANVYLFFTDSEGQVVLASNSDHLTGDAVPAEVLARVDEAEGGVYHELGKMGGAFDERFYVSARPIRRGDEPGAYLFVCASGQMLEAFVGRFGSNFLLSACLMLICASVLTMFLMRNLTEPLHRISEAAQKFGGGDFSVRVEDVDGDGEIADLARTFNTMAANLQEIDSSRGQFMGNIAHELRTPMTTIKGFIDGILDGTIPPEPRAAEPLPAAGQPGDGPSGPAGPEYAGPLQAGIGRVPGQRPDVQHLGDPDRRGPLGRAADQRRADRAGGADHGRAGAGLRRPRPDPPGGV